MSLVGLDLNASRARAVAGPSTQKLSLVRLDAERVELPLAISLEERIPRVGRAGFALTRSRSHLACLDFLPYIGTSRVWSTSEHEEFDAERALEIVFDSLNRSLGRSSGIACIMPSYLDETQTVQIYRLATQTRLPIMGSISAPVAAVLASPMVHSSEAETGFALVVDSDGHALTWSVVERDKTQLRLRMVQPGSHLSRGIWLRKLLDGVSHRCVRTSRRDPRESALTEQAVYEQLANVLDQESARVLQLHIQGGGWFANLMVQADELAVMVTPLLRQFVADLESVLATVETLGELLGVVVTHAAAGLPGLVQTLEARLAARPRSPLPAEPEEEGDYGDQLVEDSKPELVHVLPIDALVSTAHALALRIHAGEFPRGHHEAVALGAQEVPTNVDTGPPRISFRGRDHVLKRDSFTLGRDPTCDLVFESELYPHVSAKHCEIVYDRRAYVIYDRSRHGTLLNDRPVEQQAALHSGDWIRLGPRGPVMRFLGTAGTTR
jgi:hypothetical protein